MVFGQSGSSSSQTFLKIYIGDRSDLSAGKILPPKFFTPPKKSFHLRICHFFYPPKSQQKSNLYISDPFFSTTNITGQPLVLDANADLKLDLYSTYEDTRTFWVNDGQTFHMEPQGTSDTSPISDPNSNAFVDLNGDCISDLVVTSIKNNVSQFEFWLNENGGFKLDKVFKAAVGAGQVTFADFSTVMSRLRPC